MTHDVVIYSTPTCHFCKEVKEFFAENEIEYVNYDVAIDTERRGEMIKLSGQMGVPVVVIDGKVSVGFNRTELATKLGIAA